VTALVAFSRGHFIIKTGSKHDFLTYPNFNTNPIYPNLTPNN